jgi:hypothetical protein
MVYLWRMRFKKVLGWKISWRISNYHRSHRFQRNWSLDRRRRCHFFFTESLLWVSLILCFYLHRFHRHPNHSLRCCHHSLLYLDSRRLVQIIIYYHLLWTHCWLCCCDYCFNCGRCYYRYYYPTNPWAHAFSSFWTSFEMEPCSFYSHRFRNYRLHRQLFH